MGIRTDLAIEFMADKTSESSGVDVRKYESGAIKVTSVDIFDKRAAERIGRPVGIYVTLETDRSVNIFELDELRGLISDELRKLVGDIKGCVLVVGIGNDTVTPDALGPKTAEGVLATRHISSELADSIGLKGLKSVAVISPGVLGQTGIEAKEIIEGAVERVRPELILLIDALAAREVSRLGCTVQLSNNGISPGSGVGNARSELSENTLGVRCITVGVPTVVDASTLCYDLTGKSGSEHDPLIVTPRDIDRLILKSSQAIAYSINTVLQSEIDSETLMSCV